MAELTKEQLQEIQEKEDIKELLQMPSFRRIMKNIFREGWLFTPIDDSDVEIRLRRIGKQNLVYTYFKKFMKVNPELTKDLIIDE